MDYITMKAYLFLGLGVLVFLTFGGRLAWSIVGFVGGMWLIDQGLKLLSMPGVVAWAQYLMHELYR